jgi:hypothetical protein
MNESSKPNTDKHIGVHCQPNTLFREAVRRSLGWASESELRALVATYTGVRLSLAQANRFSQDVAELVIVGLERKHP